MNQHEPVTALLDLDPELGHLLGPARAEEAHAELGVRVSLIPRGPWDADRLAAAHPENLGLLLLDGVMAREVLIADTVSTELLGRGDVVRPWHEADDSRLLAWGVRWTALSDTRLAVLDRRFSKRLVRFPEVNAMLVERLIWRAQRMAVSQAISQLNGVDRRLLALFWHLGERWGRMTPTGVAIPMALSHRVLAQLVGARRPTVSTALATLAERDELVRRDDGTWLLSGDPVGTPDAEVARLIEHRRRLLPPESPPPVEVLQVQHTALSDRLLAREDISARMERLRRTSETQQQRLREASEVSQQLVRLTSELRERRQGLRVNGHRKV